MASCAGKGHLSGEHLQELTTGDVIKVDVDIERKQAQAIASLPDSVTQLLCLL